MSIVCPTPQVLKWARESSGYSLDEVVSKLNRKTINRQTLLEWENGKSFPSYPQLENLAYKIYKRPLAVFFFPAPPDESGIKRSFRTLPQAVESLNPRMRWIIRKARAMQLNVMELYEDENLDKTISASPKIFNDIRFTTRSSIKSLAQKTRDYLNISLEEQKEWSRQSVSSWDKSDTALKKWREIIQSHGVFVFKDSFKDSDFSGFCLYDSQFPVIYINNNEPKNRQIFTLFHELAHILFQTSGFDPADENYFRGQLKANNKKLEVMCNEFAGAFLVPDDSLPKTVNLNDIKKQADSYSVSQETFLLRLLKNNLITRNDYNKSKNKISEKYRNFQRKKTSGGNYYATTETYLGKQYISLAFKRYYQKRISLSQLADFLNVRPKVALQIDPFKQK